MKKKIKIALLGDNEFPPLSISHISQRRDFALRQAMEAILTTNPGMVYLCPTKGVNINVLPLIMLNKIPFRLIFPSQDFFRTLTSTEKQILKLALERADKVIILSEEDCGPMDWAEKWYEASRRAVDSADSVVVAHNPNYFTAFDDLIVKFEGCLKPVIVVPTERAY